MRRYTLVIDGDPIDTDETREIRSPYSGDVVGEVAVADAGHATRAARVAETALAQGPPPQHERATALERARTLVAERAEDFARSIAEEAGKPITTARAEVERCQDTLTYAAIEARTLGGEVVPFDGSAQGAGKLGFTVFEPKGAVFAITPFNFPLNLVCHKLAPAFAAGCPVIVKPAGDTPLTAHLLVDTLHEAGVPPAMLQILTGSSSTIGEAVLASEAVRVISFTGSTEVGHMLMEQNPHKEVLAELGSNSPVLVDASADIPTVAARLAKTGYSYAGQSCISAQRVYVHQQSKDALLDQLAEQVAALRVGDPLDDDTDVGPLIRPDDRDRVKAWVDEAVAQGAKLRLGGEVNDDGTLQPVILDDVTQDMKVSREEIFGPVLVIQPVADMDEAVRLANDSRYGLNAGIFTADHDTALRAVRDLRFGAVLVNESPTYRADQMPYGGVRDSGNTREGPRYAVQDYLERKLVVFSTPAS